MSFNEFSSALRESGKRRSPRRKHMEDGPLYRRRLRARLRLARINLTRLPRRAIGHARVHLAGVAEITGATSPSHAVAKAVQSLRSHVMLVVGFSAGINLLYLAPSLYMMQVYDRVLPTSGLLTLLMLSIVLLVAFAVMGSLDALRGRLLARASLRVERLAAEPIMRQVFAARRAQAGGHTGIRDLDTLRNGLASPAMIGLLDIPWTPLFILICFVIHPAIGILAVAGAALIFALALINERSSRGAIQGLSQESSNFFAGHEADLGMAETMHALGAESAMTRRRIAARGALVEAQTQSAFGNANYSALTKAVRQVLQSAALGLGCYLAVEQQMSPGAIIAATILTARAFAPVEQIVGGWRQLGMALQAYRDLRQLLEGASDETERTPLPAPRGRIQLDHVSAAAPGGRVTVLEYVSFAAQPGEIVGIIGPSGAGKTTLARILANATQPMTGAIRIDGAKYSDWDPEALAKHIGYLPQRIDLFDGTISENISCFARLNGEPMDEVGPKVVDAARIAAAHEMILGLPEGYETRLGFNGAGVSPGQAQRIALARALYGDPRIVILDEPNSHLDSEGEAALVHALNALRSRGAACFIVAHRSGVVNALDKLVVLAGGRLIDFGPRADVITRLNNSNVANARTGEARIVAPT
jgi:PrtD family type I secretion system ABC transporter